MRRKRVVMIAAICLVAVLSSIRIEYHRFNWGGYWSVDFAAPWQR